MITGSKKQLLDLIKRKGTLSVDQACKETDLSKTTLREHFLQLERDGFVDRDYIRSGPGRPSLCYCLTRKGDSFYPSNEPEVLREFLRYLKSQGQESTIEEFFNTYWESRYVKAERMIEEHPSEDHEARLVTLAKMLEQEGFMPQYKVNRDDGSIMIRECNCPFEKIVGETRLPCRLEAEFYKRLFGGKVERVSYIPDGEYSCTYCIHPSMEP